MTGSTGNWMCLSAPGKERCDVQISEEGDASACGRQMTEEETGRRGRKGELGREKRGWERKVDI